MIISHSLRFHQKVNSQIMIKYLSHYLHHLKVKQNLKKKIKLKKTNNCKNQIHHLKAKKNLKKKIKLKKTNNCKNPNFNRILNLYRFRKNKILIAMSLIVTTIDKFILYTT